MLHGKETRVAHYSRFQLPLGWQWLLRIRVDRQKSFTAPCAFRNLFLIIRERFEHTVFLFCSKFGDRFLSGLSLANDKSIGKM